MVTLFALWALWDIRDQIGPAEFPLLVLWMLLAVVADVMIVVNAIVGLLALVGGLMGLVSWLG